MSKKTTDQTKEPRVLESWTKPEDVQRAMRQVLCSDVSERRLDEIVKREDGKKINASNADIIWMTCTPKLADEKVGWLLTHSLKQKKKPVLIFWGFNASFKERYQDIAAVVEENGGAVAGLVRDNKGNPVIINSEEVERVR